MTILEQANKVPPCICRILARKTGGKLPMSNVEVAKKSGLARSTVAKLSKLKSWGKVPLRTVEKFSIGCGVDLLRPSHQIAFFRRRKLTHLRTGTAAQNAMARRVLTELAQK